MFSNNNKNNNKKYLIYKKKITFNLIIILIECIYLKHKSFAFYRMNNNHSKVLIDRETQSKLCIEENPANIVACQ